MRFQSLQPSARSGRSSSQRRSAWGPARHRAARRRSGRLIPALLALVLALPTLAWQAIDPPAAQAAPGTVTLVGDLQSELGCAEDWAPACPATAMTGPDADGVYSLTATVPAGTWALKVALDGTWDVSYGADGARDGANIPLRLAADSELTLTWDSTSHRIGVRSSALAGDYDAATDAALVADPVRQGTDEVFYFVLTDRFANGDASNDAGGLTGGPEVTGLDPTNKGYYHGGDIAGIIDNLDYIQSLGTTALWLTPSFANQPVQGTGENASAGYHGYWVTDFTSIDPHLGGNDSLAALRDALHARGMKLYLDIIVNHTADLIDYTEGQYSYVDTATVPYTDAAGNPVDISALAGSDSFPTFDAATSFPYTPVRHGDVVPETLNDVTMYHNRGDSTWTGESVTMGDFVGLDDLMTEDPRVVAAFGDIYTSWMDFGVDGFRIDTVKHVNFEFWDSWTATIDDHAAATNPDFFTFGEVYDADARLLSPYVRSTGMDATLDFAFQSAAVNFAKGYTAQGLSGLYASDDYYTTATTSAAGLPTFLGNHDMGRVGFLLGGGAGGQEVAARDALAHSLMFLTRGQPVVYYGDEQGFAGLGDGTDKNARQDMFATQVAEYADQPLVDGTTAGSTDRYDTSSSLYQHISTLSALRAAHPALSTGAQIELYAEAGAGVYAFARVDREEKIEHLVALNNAAEERTVTLTTLTPGATYTSLYGDHATVTADAAGSVTLTVPALGAVVLVADTTVAAGDPDVTITNADGAALAGATAEVAATTTADRWAETTFAYRELGSQEWTVLGTAEDDTPRVFADLSALPVGTLVELRAVTTDAAGNRAADSALGVVGADLSGTDPGTQPSGDQVTVPGSHNAAMGCPGDWQPDCANAALSLDKESGLYTGSFNLPAGSYEYKVAVGGSWDVNYGADGVAGGPNIPYTTAGGTVTFFYDPVSHRVWNDAEWPQVTLPGSFQAALGCTQGGNGGNWDPACLATLMRPVGDGTYTFTTDKIPTGSWEVKVAHGRSWDENYGVDGVRDGANYSFAATAGTSVTFTYTLETHLLTIEATDPPVAGTGEQRAYWVDATTLAWPVSLLPDGVPRTDVVADDGTPVAGPPVSLSLVTAPDGGAQVSGGAVSGGTETPLRITGNLPQEVLAAYPHLADYIAVSLTGADSEPAMSREEVEEALTGQVAVVQRSGADAGAGTVTAFTGVQIAPVLDSLYAEAAGDAALGVTWDEGGPAFALWAPTARSVTLLTWETGDPTGSVPLVDGQAVRHEAVRGADGRWTVDNADGAIGAGAQYLWEVEVYAPTTGKVETNEVTDPYSVGLTLNSTRSVAVDLADPALAPEQWASTPAPVVPSDAGRTIYELHLRDFSAADTTVPEAERGTYMAFTHADSAGMTHLAALAEAGVDTVHLLPTFDIATIEEDRAAQVTAEVPEAGPADTAQQAAVTSTKDTDAYNWGYDPYHYTTPEGSYATTGNQDGGARTVEFRQMVGALHATGLQVVLDEVYNHTSAAGQADTAVLDRVVPGYYHRLDAAGAVTTSTCCSNTATENAMMERLMVDSVVTWARDYHVDGFRFDLMGHHSVDTMAAVRSALDALTLEDDGVDGAAIYLYGEGWNFGEVADNARFTQATQGQLDGTGIGTFNDRMRDAVRGGGPFDADQRVNQGFGSGLSTDPNGVSGADAATQAASLAHATDLVKLGLVGNLKDYTFTTSEGTVMSGSQIDYNGQGAGYASQPEETINYVDAHDNETLFDSLAYKLPTATSMSDRVRMSTMSLSTVALGQSPAFWASGTEILRSKSMDRDSYNSGDYYNAIDWTKTDNGFGAGLPVEGVNSGHWDVMRPLLEDPSLKPGASDIETAEDQALDLLRIRSSTTLFGLGDADAIQAKVSFPNSGPEAPPGVITMLIDDRPGSPAGPAPGGQARGAEAAAALDADPALAGVLVVFNASPETVTQTVVEAAGRTFVLHSVQAEGADDVVKTSTFDPVTGTVSVPARTTAVFVEAQTADEPTAQPTDPAGEPTDPAGEPTDPAGEPTDPAAPQTEATVSSPGATGPTPRGTAVETGSERPSSSGGLPVTGVSVGILVLAAVLLGGGLLLLRRRR